MPLTLTTSSVARSRDLRGCEVTAPPDPRIQLRTVALHRLPGVLSEYVPKTLANLMSHFRRTSADRQRRPAAAPAKLPVCRGHDPATSAENADAERHPFVFFMIRRRHTYHSPHQGSGRSPGPHGTTRTQGRENNHEERGGPKRCEAQNPGGEPPGVGTTCARLAGRNPIASFARWLLGDSVPIGQWRHPITQDAAT